jgi:hypothetical protein
MKENGKMRKDLDLGCNPGQMEQFIADFGPMICLKEGEK